MFEIVMGIDDFLIQLVKYLIFSNCSFLSLQSFIVTAFCIFLSTKPCFFKSCFTTWGVIFILFDSKAFEISLRLRFVHFISLSIGLPAVWSFKISTKTSSIFSTVSMIFFLPPTRLSNPVLRCFCTIGNFINSSHDSLKMAPQHTAYVVLSPRDLISLLRWLHILFLSLIHISEPTRRTPISYAVFCLKKK